MTTEPPVDPAADSFAERLAAHLDRAAAREPDDARRPGADPDAADPDLADPDPNLDPAGLDRDLADLDLDPADLDLDPAGLDRDPADLDLEARLDGVVAALSSRSAWSEPPDLRSAVLARIRAAAGPEPDTVPDATAAPGTHPAPDAAAVLGSHPGSGRGSAPAGLATVTPLRPRWQRLTVAIPVAAAAAALVTFAVLGTQQVLAPDPDQTFAALGAGGLRADVSVTSMPSGFEITLDTEDLPAAPAGAYYAGWLRRGPGPGDVVPIGTFHGRRVGGAIVLWSGVDPAEYRTFSVTLQREGEPPVPNAPSARRVLVGALPD